MKTSKVRRNLECKLTDQELKEYSKRLADCVSRKSREEDSLKSYSTQAKAKIQSCDAEINLLSEKINTEKEYRMIDCTVEYDFKKGIKSITRNDTDEVVDQEIISEEERQEELSLQK